MNDDQKLNPEQLDTVTGGQDEEDTLELHMCPGCDMKTYFKMYGNGRGICTMCGWRLE